MSKQAERSAEIAVRKKNNSATNPDKRNLYINRELSHLAFNLRVLDQARDTAHPLLERLNFLLIFSSNLDEFYEVRISGLKKQIHSGRARPGPDGRPTSDVLQEIHRRARTALDEQYRILNDDLLPALASENVHFLPRHSWNDKLGEWCREYFFSEILPVISPLGLDPAHPFPRLVNKSLNFILSLEGKDAFGRESGLAIVPAPRALPRLIKVPKDILPDGDNFIFLSSIIHAHVEAFFPGMQVTECHQFRVTRNTDLEMSSVEVEDIPSALQGELQLRRFGAAAKLEVSDECPGHMSDFLLQRFNLTEQELFRLNGPVNLQRMIAVNDMLGRPRLRFQPFVPGTPAELKDGACLFTATRKDDLLLHHPFESFLPIIDWVRQAARDPGVISIKQTLYRTNESSELVAALADAARQGKEVTVVIELRARFDEEDNIQFASVLQEAGAVVVYGVLGYKTHAKMLLIVRRENGSLRRYAHLGTGNYHRKNSLVYTDYSLFTSDQTLCADVFKVFQQITGMGKKIRPDLIQHAPFRLHKVILENIQREREVAREGKATHIIIKVNGLTDKSVIDALYEASGDGVKIELIVRGVCCLRPGIPGISDNIRVISTIGRFLEHSRVYYFRNSTPALYCSSADWMERNLHHRIEVAFPILKKKWFNRILQELQLYIQDRGQSWELNAEGNYQRIAVAGGSEKDVSLPAQKPVQRQLLSLLSNHVSPVSD